MRESPALLDPAYVLGLLPLPAASGLEAYPLTLFQAAEPAPLYGGVGDEKVLSPLLGHLKAVAFLFAESLHCSPRHASGPPSAVLCPNAHILPGLGVGMLRLSRPQTPPDRPLRPGLVGPADEEDDASEEYYVPPHLAATGKGLGVGPGESEKPGPNRRKIIGWGTRARNSIRRRVSSQNVYASAPEDDETDG